jgi:hypothetical protein
MLRYAQHDRQILSQVLRMSWQGVRHKQNILIRHPERLYGNQKFDLVGYLPAVQASEGSRLVETEMLCARWNSSNDERLPR